MYNSGVNNLNNVVGAGAGVSADRVEIEGVWWGNLDDPANPVLQRYDGSSWIDFVGGGAGTAWNTTGNALAGIGTLGSTTDVDFNVVRNSITYITFDTNGVDFTAIATMRQQLVFNQASNNIDILPTTAATSIRIGGGISSPAGVDRTINIGNAITNLNAIFSNVVGSSVNSVSGSKKEMQIHGALITLTNVGTASNIFGSSINVNTGADASTGNVMAFGTQLVINHAKTLNIGRRLDSAGDNTVTIAHNATNLNDGGYTDYYFGNGIKSKNLNLRGVDVTFHASGSGDGTDLQAGDFIIASGIGTGNTQTVFKVQTPTPLASGTTRQTLADRLTIDETDSVFTTTLETAAPAGGAGKWKLGQQAAGVVALDIANYIEVEIDGVLYKLGIVT